jgi:LDH2 family malate/lactate/ureidoglycolate dehydrogenase
MLGNAATARDSVPIENTTHDSYLIQKHEMESFMERCMLTAGSKPHHAKSLASCLIAADYRGHFSHGLNRLGKPQIHLKSH